MFYWKWAQSEPYDKRECVSGKAIFSLLFANIVYKLEKGPKVTIKYILTFNTLNVINFVTDQMYIWSKVCPSQRCPICSMITSPPRVFLSLVMILTSDILLNRNTIVRYMAGLIGTAYWPNFLNSVSSLVSAHKKFDQLNLQLSLLQCQTMHLVAPVYHWPSYTERKHLQWLRSNFLQLPKKSSLPFSHSSRIKAVASCRMLWQSICALFQK